MSLVPSLLRAIVTVGGNALVLQAGEKPYVSSPTGPIDLAAGGMSTEAIADVIGQLLPVESQSVLTQFGAVQHDLKDVPDFPGERFQVLARNEGTILGVEIRRESASPSPSTAEPQVAPATGRRRAGDRRDKETHSEAELPAPIPAVAPAPDRAVAGAVGRRSADVGALERLLQITSAEGATAVYLASGLPPWMRVDDELRVVEGAGPLGASQIEAMLTRAPAGGSSGTDSTREWFWEFAEHGRLRCTSFRDHRGSGLVLRSVPTRPPTSRSLGLSREVEALTSRDEGLLVVAAPHTSAARMVVAALVDAVNRLRRVHVICVEREITVIHESEASLVSQREAGRSVERLLELSRAALREHPDVLVLDSVQSADLVSLALDAAQSGHLVICPMRAANVEAALEALIGQYPVNQRQKAQIALSRALVGVVAEPMDVTGKSHPSGRELLVNTPESAYLIAEGRFTGLGHPDRRR